MELSEVKRQCLRLLLRPVMKFCLRQALSVQQVVETAKVIAIELAKEDMERRGEKVNISRLSVMTGIRRREIRRILENPESEPASGSLATRVVGQWENDARFRAKNNQPRALTSEEFRELVALVSTDVNPTSILFELERTGAVERRDKVLRLKRTHYVPKGNPLEGFYVLAKDSDDLIAAVEENVFDAEGGANLHGRTEFDNIAREHITAIRKWLIAEGSEFHQKVRQYLSKFDLDINPTMGHQGGARVSLGTFSRIEGDDE